MKIAQLLNSDISAVISQMGHSDTLTVADCGLPINETKRIDLALKRSVPGLLETLDTVLTELSVEKIILSENIRDVSPEILKAILSRFSDDIEVDYVEHTCFKKMTELSKAIIRTGECTFYANVILVAGVAF